MNRGATLIFESPVVEKEGIKVGRPKLKIDKEQLEKMYVYEKKSSKEIAQILSCSQQSILNHLRYFGIPVRSKGEAAALGKIQYARKSFSEDPIEKAYMIGFRIGDLTVDRINEGGQTIRVSCASTKNAQIELIQELFEPYGRVLINGPYQNGRRFIQCLVDLSFDFLLEKHTKIPDWILSSSELLFSFLGGYSDAEAHIGISGRKASYRLASSDKKILFQTYRRISRLGIEGPPPRKWLLGGYRNKKTGVITRKNIWRLGIYRKDSLRSFMELLSPYLRHAKRRRDAEEVLQFLS